MHNCVVFSREHQHSSRFSKSKHSYIIWFAVATSMPAKIQLQSFKDRFEGPGEASDGKNKLSIS